MKKPITNLPIRPFFTAVLVFAVAAVTLSLRLIITGAGKHPTQSHHHPQLFNQTLISFSALDLSDSSLRHNVEHLVDENFQNPRFNLHRSFRSIGRYRLDIGSRSVNGGRDSPEFHNFRLNFRRNLQNWWKNRFFDPDVMSKLVNSFEIKHKYKTCAVVGNSGILLKTNLGGLIDAHEFVIRLNNARIGGFEKRVGSKTSLSFMNSNILHLCSRRGGCFCHPYGEKARILMYISQPVHFLDYAVCNESHKWPVMVTDPQFDVLCARLVKYYSVKRFVMETGKGLEEWSLLRGGSEFHYSSGMQAVMFALGVCEKVSIFGFGKSDLAKHHYHTNQKNELSLHDYQAEYDLYEDLVKNPKAVPFVSDKFKFPPVVIHR